MVLISATMLPTSADVTATFSAVNRCGRLAGKRSSRYVCAGEAW